MVVSSTTAVSRPITINARIRVGGRNLGGLLGARGGEHESTLCAASRLKAAGGVGEGGVSRGVEISEVSFGESSRGRGQEERDRARLQHQRGVRTEDEDDDDDDDDGDDDDRCGESSSSGVGEGGVCRGVETSEVTFGESSRRRGKEERDRAGLQRGRGYDEEEGGDDHRDAESIQQTSRSSSSSPPPSRPCR
jgi:hypothetical protein